MSPLQATLLLDPNWPERGGGKSVRGAQRHYDLMPVHAMPRLIYQAKMPDGSFAWNPHPDAHVWMWATKNYLADALWLMGALGVRHVTDFTWIKLKDKPRGDIDAIKSWLNQGIGQYGRGCKEHLLFGVMQGSKDVTRFRTDRKDIPDVFESDDMNVMFAPLGEHSEKPQSAYELIEARSACPEGMERMEFFARAGRPGWRAWGNEAPQEGATETEEQAAARVIGSKLIERVQEMHDYVKETHEAPAVDLDDDGEAVEAVELEEPEEPETEAPVSAPVEDDDIW